MHYEDLFQFQKHWEVCPLPMDLYVDVIRAYTVTLIIKNKTKGIRDSGRVLLERMK
ncbi:P44-41 outer membrane, silent domain protein [Anaplasma phagocytophilum str. CRT53-1]|uniref:p44-41 outer membrane, silent domain protein n=1 Tax=Anaplasma phagocytophilum str. CRT53-1 TaxID=1359157 RepID=A0A0F3QA85_ANAPH|nr:P44-41 outer membrane, silent domain protein [Anaplasma phagocytophilum str. CRT53-1]